MVRRYTLRQRIRKLCQVGHPSLRTLCHFNREGPEVLLEIRGECEELLFCSLLIIWIVIRTKFRRQRIL